MLPRMPPSPATDNGGKLAMQKIVSMLLRSSPVVPTPLRPCSQGLLLLLPFCLFTLSPKLSGAAVNALKLVSNWRVKRWVKSWPTTAQLCVLDTTNTLSEILGVVLRELLPLPTALSSPNRSSDCLDIGGRLKPPMVVFRILYWLRACTDIYICRRSSTSLLVRRLGLSKRFQGNLFGQLAFDVFLNED